MGYELNEGVYSIEVLSEDRIWAIFNSMLSSSVRATSYKFGFLKSIMDNLYNVDHNLTLTFDQLFYKFTEIYWNLILKHELRQSSKNIDGKITAIERILYEARNDSMIVTDISFEKLNDNAKSVIVKKVKTQCKKFVVGALYEDSNNTLYSFSKKEEYIKLNPRMYEFLTKHKLIIEKMNYYEWAKYLEKVNDESSTRNLLNNLDYITLRNDLSYYRRILYEELEQHRCFYCDKELVENKIHVDHFIPWSFIKDDNIWNFVLSCQSCNIKKSDKLVPEIYVETLIHRNKVFHLSDARSTPNLLGENRLRKIYDWASSNSYKETWQPPNYNVVDSYSRRLERLHSTSLR